MTDARRREHLMPSVVASFILLFAGCGRSEPTIDGSSPESFVTSLKVVRERIPEPDREHFDDLVTLIAVQQRGKFGGGATATTDASFRDHLHGLTATEVWNMGGVILANTALPVHKKTLKLTGENNAKAAELYEAMKEANYSTAKLDEGLEDISRGMDSYNLQLRTIQQIELTISTGEYHRWDTLE